MLKIFEIFDKYTKNGEKVTFLMILNVFRGIFVSFVKILYFAPQGYLHCLESRFGVAWG